MNTLATIALSIAIIVWAVVVWDLGCKWIAERSAAALMKRQIEHEEKTAAAVEQADKRGHVNKLAIENLAKEVDESLATLRAQQVGVISGMSAAAARPRSFR